jgi:hypothetical protein
MGNVANVLIKECGVRECSNWKKHLTGEEIEAQEEYKFVLGHTVRDSRVGTKNDSQVSALSSWHPRAFSVPVYCLCTGLV